MDRAPPVESDLSDIKPGAKILNELLDIPVVHHVTLSRFKESLTVPQVVGDVIAGDPEFEVVFEYPKSRCDPVLLIVPIRWEYENESSDIGGGCQVEPATTNTAFQLTQINRVCFWFHTCVGIHRTDCFTHWLSRSCGKVFSSAEFCLALLDASRYISIGTATPGRIQNGLHSV